jgi:hypothetical protein
MAVAINPHRLRSGLPFTIRQCTVQCQESGVRRYSTLTTVLVPRTTRTIASSNGVSDDMYSESGPGTIRSQIKFFLQEFLYV